MLRVTEPSKYLHWIKFNFMTSQLITFGGENPNQCTVALNNTSIPRATTVKYLGVYLFSKSGLLGISDDCRKFYGQFNNIMSVLGKCSREMSAIHLIKTTRSSLNPKLRPLLNFVVKLDALKVETF